MLCNNTRHYTTGKQFRTNSVMLSSCVLGFFARGVFQKMPALEGQILKEISVRFAGENHLRTQKTQKKALRRGS